MDDEIGPGYSRNTTSKVSSKSNSKGTDNQHQ